MYQFLNVHEDYFYSALKEIQEGHKKSHWMWFIFPKPRGFGHSINTWFYGITSGEEVKLI